MPEPAKPAVLPAITTLDQADEALRELAELARIETAATTRYNQVASAAKVVQEEKLMLERDGQPVKLADRRDKLKADLEIFALENKSLICIDGKKSRVLNHGTIGFEMSRPRIEVLEAEKDEDTSRWEVMRKKVLKALVAALSAMRLGLNKLNASLITLKIDVDKRGVLAAYKAEEINDSHLQRMGLRHVAAQDEFWCEPKAEAISSHESPAAAA